MNINILKSIIYISINYFICKKIFKNYLSHIYIILNPNINNNLNILNKMMTLIFIK